MTTVRACEVPPSSLLQRYRNERGFADCYVTQVHGLVRQADFIEAFYTSPLFKMERALIGMLAFRWATDADVRQLAAGNSLNFSAWRVEDRLPAELLLADFTGRTRSWLMTAPGDSRGKGDTTLLYFGSAVIGRPGKNGQQPRMGWLFHALMGFHSTYSRLLLSAASRRVLAR